jgi:hypothetical protein
MEGRSDGSWGLINIRIWVTKSGLRYRRGDQTKASSKLSMKAAVW